MEDTILDLENQINELNQQMSLYQNDYDKLVEISNLASKLNSELEAKNERWLELLEKQEQSQNNSR
ncbi:ABC transporter C-terminal domain-containing protein [Coprobacillaceae bacterium CR2/5/TPMF4]|nr:ABC transporter C-terminal domain-containing protein [Coprobacillaceae bacterium CR2/5/TPMF4]